MFNYIVEYVLQLSLLLDNKICFVQSTCIYMYMHWSHSDHKYTIIIFPFEKYDHLYNDSTLLEYLEE